MNRYITLSLLLTIATFPALRGMGLLEALAKNKPNQEMPHIEEHKRGIDPRYDQTLVLELPHESSSQERERQLKIQDNIIENLMEELILTKLKLDTENTKFLEKLILTELKLDKAYNQIAKLQQVIIELKKQNE